MNADELLSELHSRGVDESADYDDNLLGWFGWRLDGPHLTVHFTDSENKEFEASWTLIPRVDA